MRTFSHTDFGRPKVPRLNWGHKARLHGAGWERIAEQTIAVYEKAGKRGGWEAMRLEGGEAGMSEDRWRNLEVWKLADALAHNIYLATRDFPKEEVYGIVSQLRRAGLSIPTRF